MMPPIPPIRWLVRRLRELRGAEVALLGRAFLYLLTAKLALRVVPVRFILGWKQRPVRRRDGLSPAAQAEQIRLAGWAVASVARRSPVRFVCFPQSLAAHALLAAAGIETRLHYGVARTDGKLEAHAWLEAGGVIVTGAEQAATFTLLKTY